jgi:hypothetical protein
MDAGLDPEYWIYKAMNWEKNATSEHLMRKTFPTHGHELGKEMVL